MSKPLVTWAMLSRPWGSWTTPVACYRLRFGSMRPDSAKAHSNLVCTLNYCPGYDARAIHEEQRRWNQLHAEPLAKFIRPHANERSTCSGGRIGYVSPDFPRPRRWVLESLLPLFREHDHRQFEIVCYANRLERDKITDRFQGYADVWHSVAALTDEALAQRIREDRIDILSNT